MKESNRFYFPFQKYYIFVGIAAAAAVTFPFHLFSEL